ncbi:MAG: acetyl-CoA hydrolase/transferase C-terminal domain-containing protein [Methylocystis silviterrae]|uniref:acetyl-CoA hydrolase/transferase C-terminal domain-containing protein n=1 Tax=Methylocystis silviterrae TaxID=2743612 RepID=UPI003C71EA51
MAERFRLALARSAIAVAYGLCLRQEHNKDFCEALSRLDGDAEQATDSSWLKLSTEEFSIGLYAASEMFVESFLDLYRAGVLRRTAEGGVLLHSAFFLGSSGFYRALRELPEAERDRFRMTAVSFVNQLYGDEHRKRRDRIQARFVNTTMMVTALGAAISDTLDDGRVVSVVGGQYNFVAQAFALDDARSLMTLPATRHIGGRFFHHESQAPPALPGHWSRPKFRACATRPAMPCRRNQSLIVGGFYPSSR